MGWTGDISRIGKLAQNIARLARVPSQASAAVSKGIGELIEEEFGGAKDPYGAPWQEHAPETVARWGPHPILQLTQAMRSSVDVKPMAGAGVSITVGAPYAAPHQTGWSGPQGSGPARPVLPARGMPPAWKAVIENAVTAEVRKVVA